MKTHFSYQLIGHYCYLLILAATFGCSDTNLEPIGLMPDPDDPIETPMDDEVDEGNEISDNPVLRLNCGGEEIGYGDTVFTEDEFFGGATMDTQNMAISDILETQMDDLYISQRTSIDPMGNFEYVIPITNGNYRLKLHFAEIFYGAAGGGDGSPNARVFNVVVEGTVLLEDFDIYSQAGAVTAIVKEFEVTVADQEMNIIITASTDRPSLAALEVLGDGQIISPGG